MTTTSSQAELIEVRRCCGGGVREGKGGERVVARVSCFACCCFDCASCLEGGAELPGEVILRFVFVPEVAKLSKY